MITHWFSNLNDGLDKVCTWTTSHTLLFHIDVVTYLRPNLQSVSERGISVKFPSGQECIDNDKS